MWQLLTRLDAGLLAAILAGWHADPAASGTPATAAANRDRHRRQDDGRRRPARCRVLLLSALDTSTGTILLQVNVAAKPSEERPLNRG